MTICWRRCAAARRLTSCAAGPSIDPWFLRELAELVADPEAPFAGERTYKAVDTCAAEFAAQHPLLLLGLGAAGGTVRRPQPRGRSVATARAWSSSARAPTGSARGSSSTTAACTPPRPSASTGRDAVMVNCNPETVSTDYDTSDRLYFEPLTLEDVLAVCELEQPEGVVVQFGGQTPLKLAAGLEAAGVTDPGHEHRRHRPGRGPLAVRGAAGPPGLQRAALRHRDERRARRWRAAPGVGFPLLVRPSYVLGGRAMEIVYDVEGLRDYLGRVGAEAGTAIYLDRFLEDSIEVDVDALCDGETVWIAGHHAARRGGRDPLRGLGVRAAAAHAGRRDARPYPRADHRDRQGARRRRAAQRPVRHPRR